MEFFFQGRRYKLRGAKKSEVEWDKGKNQRTLCQAVQLFAVHIKPVQPEMTVL